MKRLAVLGGLALILTWTTCCDATLAGDESWREPTARVEVVPSMVLWANLMPTFPPAPDPIHARLDVAFASLSKKPLRIEIERVEIERLRDGKVLLVFRVEPLTDWDGRLGPGEVVKTAWFKTETIGGEPFRCDTPVRGTLHVIASGDDGRVVRVPPAETQQTFLWCVY